MLIVELIYEANDWKLRRYFYRDYVIVEVFDDVGRLRDTHYRKR